MSKLLEAVEAIASVHDDLERHFAARSWRTAEEATALGHIRQHLATIRAEAEQLMRPCKHDFLVGQPGDNLECQICGRWVKF